MHGTCTRSFAFLYLLSVVAFQEKVVTLFTTVHNSFHTYRIFVYTVQVGPPDMFDTHQQLIELRKQEKELEVIS